MNKPEKEKEAKKEENTEFNLNEGPIENVDIELDDATKVLYDQSGRPLNFSDIPQDQFLQAKAHVEQGETLKILDM